MENLKSYNWDLHTMEAALHARDRVGVQDFVLLEDYRSEKAFVDNLRKRFSEDLIYTYIGQVLISVNPYKEFNIYNEKVVETYRNVNFYELPPHIFAIADAAYRSMRSESRDQCVLISGESGAGKTEASKKILQYIASSSSHEESLQRVKNRLLQSNPILEAFGNAKTNRNDNSSRFGKYMDIQFDYKLFHDEKKGAPVGGVILNYLLEKSRVVRQTAGERNFHVFYQLLSGAPSRMLDDLGLSGEAGEYQYLEQGGVSNSVTSDSSDFFHLQEALRTCDFPETTQQNLWEIIASILHLGNVSFEENDGTVTVKSTQEIQTVAKLLGCPDEGLAKALTNRSIWAEKNQVHTPLTVEQACYVRDAFAKGVYQRLFKWIVDRINKALLPDEEYDGEKSVLGILDIYGFEIFQANSFEQFCINYCNEKLQQLFIRLTLKSEQQEYLAEGIEWEPVEYFNNAVICDLVEGRPQGIIDLLDEECLRPGQTSDVTFLHKMRQYHDNHPHFQAFDSSTPSKQKQTKSIQRDEFQLRHYAGDVTYNIKGFLDKNNDLLFRDIKEVLSNTTNEITRECFPIEEISSKLRPVTVGTQFRSSLAQLMEILMSKEPSYIRCIKTNDDKRPAHFVEERVQHQVKYLGLMENLRVRRAGFAYRRLYPNFLNRYKSLCPATWPHYHGDAKDGVETLVTHLGYEAQEYSLGKTKIFIRWPQVLFRTEDALQARKHELATMLQSQFKGYKQRKIYQHLRHNTIVLQSHIRRVLARRQFEKRKAAAATIRRFIKGFITRTDAPTEENAFFQQQARFNLLLQIRQNLPTTVLDKNWPKAPPQLREASEQLQLIHQRYLVRQYIAKLSADRTQQMEQKVVAEALFKGKKSCYEASVPHWFETTRAKPPLTLNGASPKKITYMCEVVKYDRRGYKPRPRLLAMTSDTIYSLTPGHKLKDRIPFSDLLGVSVSAYEDGLLVLHVNKEQNKTKGDLILLSTHVIELVTKLIIETSKPDLLRIQSSSIVHEAKKNKPKTVDFINGQETCVSKGKNGQLQVVHIQ